MVEIHKEEAGEGNDPKESGPRSSQVTGGTHETKNSAEEKKVAQKADGTGEAYGNEPE